MIPLAELLDAWGTAIWRASWQGGLAALVVWCVCRFIPSIPARFQCWLWRLVALKFAVVLLWMAPIQLPLLPATQPATWETSEPIPFDSLQEQRTPIAEPQPSDFPTAWFTLFLVWSAIVGWQTLRIASGFRDARRLRNRCHISKNRELLDQLATASKPAGLRRTPALLEMDGDGSPMLIGIFRPAIILPITTVDRLNDLERATVLNHELAHIRRRDLLWNLVGALVRAMFFFHPSVWLCERRLRLTQEIAADEMAIALQKYDSVNYATQLVSCVSKIGPPRLLPTFAVAAAGSQQSLKQRLFAMRFIKPVSRRMVIAYGIVLGTIATLGVVPWALVAAQAPATDKVEQKSKVPQKEKTERGRFVSFKDGTLTVNANSGAMIGTTISENTKTFVWNNAEGKYKPADTAESLKEVKVGTWFMVHTSNENVTLRIGSRKGTTIGAFVSYKNDRLLLLGKNLGESYVLKYGNQVHFNKFRDDVPIYESIDGGEYKLAGTANKILGNVKEGTIVTVHGEGDDNITRVEIGVPNKK